MCVCVMSYPKLTWTLPDRGWKTSFQSKWVMFRVKLRFFPEGVRIE